MVSCNENSCKWNTSGFCKKKSISIEQKQTNEFENGKRLIYAACVDFSEVQNAGTD